MMQRTLFDPIEMPIPPCDPNVAEKDKRRLTGQNAAVLARLRQGPATADDLLDCHYPRVKKYTSRISDLRKFGFDVRYDDRTGLYRLEQ